MTRKDYILLAAALASARPMHDREGTPDHSYDRRGQHARDCEAIADVLAENPRFDRERFMRACGVQS